MAIAGGAAPRDGRGDGRHAVRRAALRGVEATGAAVPGSPKPALERMSQDLDLLVLGSRGSGPALRTLLGSTADRLLQAAHWPVIVVPRGAITGERPARAAA
jgi:nucleotide-binding universal stress UspA family protein